MQAVEAVCAIDQGAFGHSRPVRDGDPHAECFRARGDGLADMAEAEQAYGLGAKLGAHGIRAAGPVGPLAVAQIAVGGWNWRMTQKQCRHHVLGDGWLVTEATAEYGAGWQRLRSMASTPAAGA